ncbi:MAG: hypothetical protein GXW99_05430 [Clostridiales bacterium]|nr:hypothetical protein [Clostridiales bacterium]
MASLIVTKASGTTVTLPEPETLGWSISDLDSEEGSGRNQNGDMFRDRVTVKRKLEVTWLPLSAAQMSTLLHAVDDIFFTLSYPDAYTGGMKSMTCYVGDRSVPIMRYNESSGAWLWGGVSINFVER